LINQFCIYPPLLIILSSKLFEVTIKQSLRNLGLEKFRKIDNAIAMSSYQPNDQANPKKPRPESYIALEIYIAIKLSF